MDINRYTYQVSWSDDNGEFVAQVAEFPLLSWLAPDRQAAEDGLLRLVREVVDDMEAAGEDIPAPLGTQSYSGKFNVRISKSLHRKLAMTAKAEGVSLNTLVGQKLAEV